MLKSYLTTIPYTKFVLVEDNLQVKGNEIFNFLLNKHINQSQNKIHYFVFQGNFQKQKTLYQGKDNVKLYDCVSNNRQLREEDEKKQTFTENIQGLGENCIVVIDSLSNLIFQYGVSKSYKFLNDFKNNKGIIQILTTLHTDLLEDNPLDITKYFNHLSTLSVKIEPKFLTDTKRLSYIYKKSGGKVYRQIEEYRFVNEDLITEKIKKPEAKSLIEKSVLKEVNPETLSTFRIGLTEQEKISRDKVILPYLPESDSTQNTSNKEGKIFYQLDEMDDWDEEDPDDDLDI